MVWRSGSSRKSGKILDESVECGSLLYGLMSGLRKGGKLLGSCFCRRIKKLLDGQLILNA